MDFKVVVKHFQVLTRQKYLCPTNYNADYFDFHCNPYQNALDRITEIPLEWYAICGLDFTNRMEYIFIIWLIFKIKTF